MNQQNCHKNFELFSDCLDGLLLKNIEDSLRQHLQACHECQKIYRELEFIQNNLRGLKIVEPPDGFETGILKAAKEKIAQKSIPLRKILRYISYGAGTVALLFIFLFLLLFFLRHKPATPAITDFRPPNLAKKNTGRETTGQEQQLSYRNPPSHMVIRDEKEWENIWRLRNAGQSISASLPEVNFTTQMVVVIVTQDDTSEYNILGTEENVDELIIDCARTSLTHTNPPLPPYQYRIVSSKPKVNFKMINKR